jgi:hypothetical protein
LETSAISTASPAQAVPPSGALLSPSRSSACLRQRCQCAFDELRRRSAALARQTLIRQLAVLSMIGPSRAAAFNRGWAWECILNAGIDDRFGRGVGLWSLLPNADLLAFHQWKGVVRMRRFLMVAECASLASNIPMSAVGARSQGVDNSERFRSGSSHPSIGGRTDRRGAALRYPIHYLSASRPGYRADDGRNRHCYFPQEWPKMPPWPPFCD